MNRQEIAIGNGSRGFMASVVLDEPSLGLSSVLVTEIFRCPMSALGQKRTPILVLGTSALTPITDIRQSRRHVR